VNRTVDAEFQLKVDSFNDAQGGPSRIELCYDPYSERWSVWAVPVQDSHHPLGRNKNVQKLLRPFPDGSGRRGIRVFDWCERDAVGRDIGFRPLDDRIFYALHLADSFADRRHFEETFEAPAAKKELAQKSHLRELAYAARSYWQSLDRLAVNPYIKGSGDWRWRMR